MTSIQKQGRVSQSDGSRIEEQAGDNALPFRGVSPAELQKFYEGLVSGPRAHQFTFAFADLLHRVMVPRSSELCFRGCTHMASGASATEAKAFLDSLDSEELLLQAREGSCCSPMGPALKALDDCRRSFLECIERSARER